MNQKKRLNLFVASHAVENFCVFCVFRGMLRNISGFSRGSQIICKPRALYNHRQKNTKMDPAGFEPAASTLRT